MVYSRLGDKVRGAGKGELDGFDMQIHARQYQSVLTAMLGLFPRAGDYDRATAWAGLRPATPDNKPMLGGCPVENLILNTGHGSLGP